MQENPLISICILNHNGENRLPKAIPSILSQNYSNLEILFLDNGSTDKSLDYIFQFKEIKIIKSSTNLGISGGRNKLAKEVKGEYILFIDNDIELTTSDFISQLFKDYLLLKKENIGIIFPIIRPENDNINCDTGLYFNKFQNVKIKDVYKKGCIRKPGFLGGIFLINTKVFFELGGFDEKYLFNIDDNDFSMRLYNMGYSIYVDTNLCVIHHGVEVRQTLEGIGWRYQYYFCGMMRAVLKNYKMKNVVKWGWLVLGWAFIKAFKISIKYKSIVPLRSSIKSFGIFLEDLSDTLSLRKICQEQRVLDKDFFLNIR